MGQVISYSTTFRQAGDSKDSDNDGMPDSWETAHQLNPNDATDAVKDRDGDGYTNIEEFINSVVKVKM